MVNSIVLIGRLTRDCELRYTQNSKAVCSFTLAVDRKFKSADGTRETDFINVVVWGKLAELCAEYLSKGKMAAVDGRLQIRSYTDKQGNKRTATEVIADDVNFLSPKESGNRQDDDPAGFRAEDESISPDEDLPF